MTTAHKLAHCLDCGAILQPDAACASCLRPPVAGSDEETERSQRYAGLPQRVPNGGIIMPQ
jgi:hypothetical protein